MSIRNAEPETVALAVLDTCERAVRGYSPDYDDPVDADAQFMKAAVQSIQSRVRTLKRQAAALWKPEFTRMLDRCHSILVKAVDHTEKEGVRTEKMKCMACGRYEHCCKYALSGVGPFTSDWFNCDGVSKLEDNWTDFYNEYTRLCDRDFVDYTRRNRLPEQDMGEYTIGATCLRKAELYYVTNTLLMECCYEALQAVQSKSCGTNDDQNQWFYANEKNADTFLDKLANVELAIADEKCPLPSWGEDPVLWGMVEKARSRASGGDMDEELELLRARANQWLTLKGLEDREKSDEAEDDFVVISEEDDSEEGQSAQPRHHQRSLYRRRPRAILDSDDEGQTTEACAPAAARGKGKKRKATTTWPQPTRRSRRLQNRSPADEKGPREEGMDASDDEPETAAGPTEDITSPGDTPGEASGEEEYRTTIPGSRAPLPSAFHMAQEQRASGGRLPARRRCLFNLGTLQLKLLQEGRDDDSSICTNAMFTIQELLARIDQLSHTVEQ